jgi:opacity protein-like surface antigen
MRREGCIGATMLVAAWTAAHADAQWAITPQAAMNVAGGVEHGKGGPGGSVGYVGGRFGFEVDFQRYQHFFKDSEVAPLDPAAPPNCSPGIQGPCTDINTDAMGVMGNVIAVIPVGGAPRWRPYGTAGLGVIHGWTEEPKGSVERNQTDLAFNVGAGVMYSLTRRVGVRTDLRYFRAFVDEGKPDGVVFKDYGFWRATLGVTFGSLPR